MLEVIQAIHTWPQAIGAVAIAIVIPASIAAFFWGIYKLL
jgi:hypothetical protein